LAAKNSQGLAKFRFGSIKQNYLNSLNSLKSSTSQWEECIEFVILFCFVYIQNCLEIVGLLNKQGYWRYFDSKVRILDWAGHLHVKFGSNTRLSWGIGSVKTLSFQVFWFWFPHFDFNFKEHLPIRIHHTINLLNIINIIE
jgi:hypothetical protein